MALQIKEVIKEQGTTIQELADKMSISRVGLSQHINGNPSVEVLERIAAALNVGVRDLFAERLNSSPYANLVSQIRIGNRFNNYGGGNVTVIRCNNKLVHVELTSGLFSIDEIIPISLSSALLECLNFISTNISFGIIQYEKNNIIVNQVTNVEGINFFIKKTKWQGDEYRVKTLHELQNWYFLLEQNELDISML